MVKTAPPQTSGPKVALVMDWLDQTGGAERVLLAFHELYPDAPIYTSVYRSKKIDWFQDADVRTGYLNYFPIVLRRFLGPLRQLWFSHLDLSQYDLVISVTGAEAKAVRTTSKIRPRTPHLCFHLCYCHVPTQYYWQLYDDYLERPGFGILNPLARLGLKLFVKPLRKLDFAAAQRPDQIVTISQYAADLVKKYYKREAKIIHPPVNVEKFSTGNQDFSTSENTKIGNCQIKEKHKNEKKQIKSKQNKTTKNEKSQISPLKNPSRAGFVVTSRQVSWKRLDLCIKACLETGEPLTIIGEGPEHENLVRLAGGSDLIHFYPKMSQSELETFLRRAKGYLFPSQEPFGIAPVEALAAGCPVIAYGQGGALDYIQPGKNGLLFAEQTSASLAQAIRDFNTMHFPAETVRKTAAPFAKKIFVEQIKQVIEENVKA